MRSYSSRSLALSAALCAALALAAGSARAVAPGFAEARSYKAGGDPTSVAAAGLDGDGDRDLAVDNFSGGKVSVLPNRGDGAFGEPKNYRVGRYPTDVAAADLSGSKRPDLAVANSGPDTVSVLINTTRSRSTGP